jgi:hypothetical protein
MREHGRCEAGGSCVHAWPPKATKRVAAERLRHVAVSVASPPCNSSQTQRVDDGNGADRQSVFIVELWCWQLLQICMQADRCACTGCWMLVKFDGGGCRAGMGCIAALSRPVAAVDLGFAMQGANQARSGHRRGASQGLSSDALGLRFDLPT